MEYAGRMELGVPKTDTFECWQMPPCPWEGSRDWAQPIQFFSTVAATAQPRG